MKKIVLILFVVTLASCKKDNMIAYYVKNTSDKAIIFNATETGPMDSFRTIEANDSVIVSETSIKFKTPEAFFKDFYMDRKDSVAINDSKDPKNWKKHIDKSDKVIYTFNIIK